MENFVVSARKYRPATFASVVGQRHITSTLKNAIERGQLAHAYLFCGPRGTGKTSAAVWIFEQPGANVRDREADIKIVVKDGVEGLTDINQVSVKFVAMPAPAETASSGGTAMALSAVSPVAIVIAALVVALLAVAFAFAGRLKARKPASAEKVAPARWQG